MWNPPESFHVFIVEAFVAVGRLNVGRSFRLGAFAEAVDGGQSFGNPWDRFLIFGEYIWCFFFFWMQKPSNNGESIRFNGCWAFNHSSMEFNAFCLINQYINMIWFMDRSFNLSWGYAQFSSQSLMTFWRNETDPWWWLGMPLTRTPPMF